MKRIKKFYSNFVYANAKVQLNYAAEGCCLSVWITCGQNRVIVRKANEKII